jgi:hypothetical protein
MPEPFGLHGHATGDLLQIARYVGKLDPKAADPAGKLIDQTLTVRDNGCGTIQPYWLRN